MQLRVLRNQYIEIPIQSQWLITKYVTILGQPLKKHF
jgi:hypothetical protein